ncbi:hypothetical protein L3X38_015799 [Prunus dulcis]|uniref:Uncharacterized protein n=1 Tax=Prunus dulcis TaxID=3755 RepID=A0AAD4Z8J0_PRUDU|nr:hypothetical protein L3X38_015799 [Prunus dulcis]
MWNFVQVTVVLTRVLEIRFGSRELQQLGASADVWHLGRVSSFGRGEVSSKVPSHPSSSLGGKNMALSWIYFPKASRS